VGYRFRVVAQNTIGYGSGFPTMTVQSMTGEVTVGTAPLAPTTLTAALQAGPQVRLTWRDNATNESGFTIWRSTTSATDGFTQIATAPARNNTGNASYTDTTVRAATVNTTYWYKVVAVNPVGPSADSNTAEILVPVATPPAAPTNLAAALIAGPQIRLTWRDNATTETGFVIQRSTTGPAGPFIQIGTAPALSATGSLTWTDTSITVSGQSVTYTYRVAATNGAGLSAFSNMASATVPALPTAPTNLTAVNGANANKSRSVILNWIDNSGTIETGFTIERATNSLFTTPTAVTVPANTTTYTVTGLSRATQYWFRIRSNNGTIIFSVWVNATPSPILTNP